MIRLVQLLVFSGVAATSFSACAPSWLGPEKGPRLYVLDCGKIEVADASLINAGTASTQKMEFANSCYLIVHPKGLFLWDTGLPDALAKSPQGVAQKGFVFSLSKTLVSQLHEIGYGPHDVGLVGFSHMHPDHTGNANLFGRSVIFVQTEEYDAAFGPGSANYQFDFGTYGALRGGKFTKLQGDYDIFGDGSVVIKRATGHTPGHQVLYVKLRQTGGVLLSGDLVHSWDNWSNSHVPAFNYNKEDSLRAIKEIRAFLKDSNAQLWIQHDLKQNSALKHAPLYYE